ncbi:MAG: copper resistance CopC family protein, partial [Candidatus Limnocylindrales bacterium]
MHVKRARLSALLSTALLAVMASPIPVAAHAVLESTSPAAGSTVETSPAEVSATFDDGLVKSKSSIEVIAPDDSTVATGGVAADDPKTLVVGVPSLAPGTYRVRWA